MEVAPLKEEIIRLKQQQTLLPFKEAELESQIEAVENAQVIMNLNFIVISIEAN